MNTSNCTTNREQVKPNSFKTVIIADDRVLAEWFSLNPRNDRQRVAIAGDLYAVLSPKGEAKR